MALTALIIISLLFFSVLCIGVGWFYVSRELFFLGVVIMLFMGFSILSSGFQVITSENNQGTLVDVNGTVVVDTVTEFTYSSVKDSTSNGVGLLFLIIAAGVSLGFDRMKKGKELKQSESLESFDD